MKKQSLLHTLCLTAAILTLLTTGCNIGDPPFPAPGKSLNTDPDFDPTAELPLANTLLVINEIQIETAVSVDSEFIELYNPSGSEIDLSLYRIYRASATGDHTLLCSFNDPDHFRYDTLPANTIIGPGGYYLIANDQADTSLTDEADALVKDSRAGMALTASNKIYLMYNSTPDNTRAIIDMVGYGAADKYEGVASAPEIITNQSIQRKATGIDTNENSTDFEVLVTPTPTSAKSSLLAAPVAANLAVLGSSGIGTTLTGAYTYNDYNSDAESGSIRTWYRCSNVSETNMTNCTELATDTGTVATMPTYTLVSADLNNYIRFQVIPKTTVNPTTGGTMLSPAKGPVTAAGAGNLLINNSFETDTAAPPSNWTLLSAGTFTADTGTVVAQNGSNVAYFTTLTTSISGREVQSDAFAVDHDYPLEISGYFRTPEPVANTRVSFKIFYYQDAACTINSATNPDDTMTSTNLSSSDTWEKITYDRSRGEVPDDALYAKVSIRVMYVSGTGALTDRVYIDNISVMKSEDLIGTNISFESDLNAPPIGWTMVSSYGTFQATNSGVTAHDGSNVAYFTSLTTALTGREVQSSLFAVQENKDITITAWFRTPQPVANTSVSIRLFYFNDLSGTPVSDTYITAVSLDNPDEWKLIVMERTVPAGILYAKVAIRVRYNSGVGANTDIVYVDNISASQP